MKLHVVGHKGVVGGATYELFKRLGYDVTGSDKGEGIRNADVYFVCVPEGSVEEAVKGVVPMCRLVMEPEPNSDTLIRARGIVVMRSSAPPGTCKALRRGCVNVHISHNPEFLREVSAVQDEFSPARIVIGECCPEHGDLLESLYKPLRVPIVRTDPTTSELVKFASNNYFSTVISYWNTIEEVAKRLGISGHQVGMIASMDPRISAYGARFHNKYGGRCLPKDTQQFLDFCKTIDYDPVLIRAVQEVNNNLD